MKNMNLLNEVKGAASKFAGKMAIKTGEQALESACFIFTYEPKIPTELLKQSK